MQLGQIKTIGSFKLTRGNIRVIPHDVNNYEGDYMLQAGKYRGTFSSQKPKYVSKYSAATSVHDAVTPWSDRVFI